MPSKSFCECHVLSHHFSVCTLEISSVIFWLYLISFSLKLRLYSHIKSTVFSASICRTRFLLLKISSSSVLRSSSSNSNIRGPIMHKSSALFYLFLPKYSCFLNICLAFGRPYSLFQCDFCCRQCIISILGCYVYWQAYILSLYNCCLFLPSCFPLSNLKWFLSIPFSVFYQYCVNRRFYVVWLPIIIVNMTFNSLKFSSF